MGHVAPSMLIQPLKRLHWNSTLQTMTEEYQTIDDVKKLFDELCKMKYLLSILSNVS